MSIGPDAAALADRVLRALAERPERTAWELKMELKVSHTRLYLALGMLLERRAVTMTPDRMTFRVRLGSPEAAQSEAAAPVQPGAASL